MPSAFGPIHRDNESPPGVRRFPEAVANSHLLPATLERNRGEIRGGLGFNKTGHGQRYVYLGPTLDVSGFNIF